MASKRERKGKREQRKSELREPKPTVFLIVTEGAKTEPLYFEGLKDFINNKYRTQGVRVEYPRIKVEGKGRSTVKLVEEAIRLAGRTIASRVYVVFDKDDFSDFDEAIRLAERHGIGVAWSNQSFEYWIYLHFNYIAAALGREDWVRKISQLLKDQKIREQGYQKNDPEVFTIATTYGSLKKAMANAEYAEKRFPPGTPPSKCDPCTTVHRLIGELRPYIEELMH